jgi:hypothetical protein
MMAVQTEVVASIDKISIEIYYVISIATRSLDRWLQVPDRKTTTKSNRQVNNCSLHL